MVFARDAKVAARVASLRSHGIVRQPPQDGADWDGPWYYEQVELGFNYRMTDIQAALGGSQLARLPEFIARRRELARLYRKELQGLPLKLPATGATDESAWHLFVIRIAAERRRTVFEALRKGGVGVNVHYIPVHLQPYYRRLGFGPGDFPEAEQYYREAISLPLYPALTQAQQERVIAALRNALA